MSENIDAYKSGQVALQMNFAFIWPGVHADPNVGGDKSGYFPNPPARAVTSPSWAVRGSRLSPIPTARMRRWNTSNGSPSLRSRRSWWELGGYSALRAVVEDPGLRDQPALCADLPRLHGDREGFLG